MGSRRIKSSRGGFSLVELLVVIGIVAVLLGLLLPPLARARKAAKFVQTHANLVQIGYALEMYAQDNRRQLPPTRWSCSTRIEFELPVELIAGYLPGEKDGPVDRVKFRDVYRSDHTYLYKAAGPAIVNETSLYPNSARIWVPGTFPNCKSDTGEYFTEVAKSPVRYAIYSVGPNENSSKYGENPARAPIPEQYWMRHATPAGISPRRLSSPPCATPRGAASRSVLRRGTWASATRPFTPGPTTPGPTQPESSTSSDSTSWPSFAPTTGSCWPATNACPPNATF